MPLSHVLTIVLGVICAGFLAACMAMVVTKRPH